MTEAPSTDQLRTVGLFESLSDEELEKLRDMAVVTKLPEGDTLVEESATAGKIYAIIDGRAEIFLAMPDGTMTESIAILSPGEILGEASLLGKRRRSASAVAKDDITAFQWEDKQLLGFFDEHPDVAYKVMRKLALIIEDRLTSTNMLLRNTLNRIVQMV